MKTGKIISGMSLLCIHGIAVAQDAFDTLKITGYLETYYQFDFNKPIYNKQPAFFYSHNRHNEFNLNHGFIKASYSNRMVRGNLALAAGTYMNANYSAEPGGLKNIFEANTGIKLIKKKDIWLDAGIFASHIGFESAISKDCWNLTRSILAENSPYYEAGAKITYTFDNNKWIWSFLGLNGWQRITRINGNSRMSWGTQVLFKPSEKVVLNYSNFIGTDKPDSARLFRVFHNFYGIFNIKDKFGLTTGFDIGIEEKLPGTKDKNIWYSPVIILKYALNKWTFAGRLEYYHDKNGVIIATGTPHGFQTTGYSFNIDNSPRKNVLLRLEIRSLYSKDAIFEKESGVSTHTLFITSSIAISF
jgi:hypothetical protein